MGLHSEAGQGALATLRQTCRWYGTSRPLFLQAASWTSLDPVTFHARHHKFVISWPDSSRCTVQGSERISDMSDASPADGATSSVQTFHTALDSPSQRQPSSTAASSPAIRPPSAYVEAQELPRRLKEHCKIYLEEELCKSHASDADTPQELIACCQMKPASASLPMCSSLAPRDATAHKSPSASRRRAI